MKTYSTPTTRRMAELNDAVAPQIGALLEQVKERALRRPDGRVAPSSLARLNALFAMVNTALSQQKGRALVKAFPTNGEVTQADLALALSLANTALKLFRDEHRHQNAQYEYVWNLFRDRPEN